MQILPLQEKNKILAQKKPRRKKRLSWIVALSSLPLFGIVTAFGIAPNTSLDNIPVEEVVLDLSIPDISPETSASLTFWRQVNIKRGDTIAAILARLEINARDTADFLQAARESKAMRRLVPGKTIYAQTTTEGELSMMRYFYDKEKLFLMEKVDDAFHMSEQKIELDKQIKMKTGTVNSSLFAATDKAGIPNNVAAEITEIFASDIDFYRDLRKGDRFNVVYETMHDNDGEQAKAGRVLAVEYINNEKSHQAVYFQSPNGEGGYYTPEGKSLRKQFLRAPLSFSRISSGFTKARFHPVLKKWRAHKGIDYAAPTGTPVMATASGKVSFAGTQRGYGKLIILAHDEKYDTAYGHLSGFAKGLRNGKRVNQGDVIGYVGATGMATGPHLHYELRVNGVQQDPRKVVLPSAPPIASKGMAAFKKETESLVARLGILRNTQLAALN